MEHLANFTRPTYVLNVFTYRFLLLLSGINFYSFKSSSLTLRGDVGVTEEQRLKQSQFVL